MKRLMVSVLIAAFLWTPIGLHKTYSDRVPHYRITYKAPKRNTNCAWWKCYTTPTPTCPSGKVCSY